MTRRILTPTDIRVRYKQLATLKDETNGVLLYTPNEGGYVQLAHYL